MSSHHPFFSWMMTNAQNKSNILSSTLSIKMLSDNTRQLDAIFVAFALPKKRSLLFCLKFAVFELACRGFVFCVRNVYHLYKIGTVSFLHSQTSGFCFFLCFLFVSHRVQYFFVCLVGNCTEWIDPTSSNFFVLRTSLFFVFEFCLFFLYWSALTLSKRGGESDAICRSNNGKGRRVCAVGDVVEHQVLRAVGAPDLVDQIAESFVQDVET